MKATGTRLRTAVFEAVWSILNASGISKSLVTELHITPFEVTVVHAKTKGEDKAHTTTFNLDTGKEIVR